MKTLYLLRHAKAEAGSKILSDRERPLAMRGVQACQAVGAYIKAKRYVPAFVLCSPAARTKETLVRVMESAGGQWPAHYENRLYLAEAEEALRCVQEADDAFGSILLVGHNPGMHHLALLLAKPDHSRLRDTLELKYPTGALTALNFSVSTWQELTAASGKLLDFVTPGAL